jgi:hypothetical protein
MKNINNYKSFNEDLGDVWKNSEKMINDFKFNYAIEVLEDILKEYETDEFWNSIGINKEKNKSDILVAEYSVHQIISKKIKELKSKSQ